MKPVGGDKFDLVNSIDFFVSFFVFIIYGHNIFSSIKKKKTQKLLKCNQSDQREQQQRKKNK